MDRRNFTKKVMAAGAVIPVISHGNLSNVSENAMKEDTKNLPLRKFDVIVAGGGTYGVPFRALQVKGIDNLLAAGMLITTDFQAHMSTRNTVFCMGQGQAAGTAAALCAEKKCHTRQLPYSEIKKCP
jgi:hypothetical protein